MCFSSMSSFSSKSAIVLATFNIRPYPLALNPNLSNAFCIISLDFKFSLQYILLRLGVNSELENMPCFLYLSSCIFLALFTLSLISSDVSTLSVLSNFCYFTGVTST